MTQTLTPRALLSLAALLAVPSLALAHGGLADHAHAPAADPVAVMMQAAAHPMTGWDHLLAAVLVGLLAASLTGRGRWWVPVAFVIACVGGLLGSQAVGPALQPGVAGLESAVALSLVALGVALVVRVKALAPSADPAGPDLAARLAPMVAWVALAGAVHGWVHGLELAPAAAAVATQTLPTLAGLMMATAGLHALAWWAGASLLARHAWAAVVMLRAIGAVAALAGGLQTLSLAGL